MSTKLKILKGQQYLNDFVGSTPTERERVKTKQRTPSSSERPPVKKLVMSNSESMDTSGNDPEGDPQVNTEESEEEEEKLSPELTVLFKKIQGLINPLKTDIASLKTTVDHQEIQLHEIDQLTHENQKLHERINVMENENVTLKHRLNKIENQLLMNNVLFHGVTEEAWENEPKRIEILIKLLAGTINRHSPHEQLNIARSIPIVSARHLGKYNSRRTRPISVRFERNIDVKHLFENREYLPEGVFVSREFNEETEQSQRVLRPILNYAKKQRHYKGKCKLEDDILIINGAWYSVKDVHKLPTDISGLKVTSKISNQAMCFFGELNPLSNFHRCTFIKNGHTYHSSEQFIQHTKALHFADTEVANEILKCKTPLECKRLSNSINNYDHSSWQNVAKQKCLPGIESKFQQNDLLMKILKESGERIIGECTYDSFWGTGVPLHDPNCLNMDKWSNVGILGEILMQVRENAVNQERSRHLQTNTSSCNNSMD